MKQSPPEGRSKKKKNKSPQKTDVKKKKKITDVLRERMMKTKNGRKTCSVQSKKPGNS